MDIDALKSHLETFYTKAELTVVWVCKDGRRELIYGAVRFLPKFMGGEVSQGEQETDVGGKFNCRIYFVRHVLDVERGLSWYQNACINHQILMPWQNDDVIFFPQTESGKDTLVSSPTLSETFYSDQVPFRSAHGAGAQVCHIMSSERLPFLEDLITQEDKAQWVNDRLLWRISDNPMYLGSLHCVMPNPYYYRLHVGLVPMGEGSHCERIRFWFDRDCSACDLKLRVEEVVSGECAKVRDVAITSQDIMVELTGVADEVAYSVLDKNNVIIEKQGAHSFIRKIVSSFCVGRNVDVVNRAGQTVKTSRSQYTQSSVLGDDTNLPELQLKGNIIRLKSIRERQKQPKDLYVYYQNHYHPTRV